MNDNKGRPAVRLPSSVENAMYFNKPLSSMSNEAVDMHKLLAESKKLMGLDPSKSYLTNPHGDTYSEPSLERIEEKTTSNKRRFCTECGSTLTETQKFCQECGTRVS